MSVYTETVDRLSGEPYFKTVAFWADPALAKLKQIKRPAAIVIPMREDTATDDRPGAVDETDRVRFALMLVIDAKNDPTGADSLEDLETAKAKARNLLRAWRPASASEILKHQRGQLAGLGNGLGVWQQVYTTATTERAS